MMLFSVGIVHTTLYNVLVDFRPEYYILNYLTLHFTHVGDARKCIRS